ncbi:hypothetical protein GGQ85_003614 [Nitrobacter vulgaris]|uniref:hypothetical protein n=1 Tax=Nitrobacter vulgaris TaxID=29421 RepID=UPI0028631AB1|nr:hypothetical protein [Nitrobacter vulgaris]MDR6305888.1 hypothetical protein [Nitrobacter vulgaris]
MFGNATLSYAAAYDIELGDTSILDKEGNVVVQRSYRGKYQTCSVNGARLLRDAKVRDRITALLNELLRDDIVDSQLAKVITQDGDLQSKVRAINEYNKVRGRIIDKTRDVTERFAMDDVRELLAPLPQERQDELYAILTNAIAEAELLRGAAQGQDGHTR